MRLQDIQRRLRRAMTQKDDGGYRFETVWPTNRRHVDPCVKARVELQSTDNFREFAFKVYADFNLPLGCNTEATRIYADCANKALRKAQWAEELVKNKTWSLEELTR